MDNEPQPLAYWDRKQFSRYSDQVRPRMSDCWIETRGVMSPLKVGHDDDLAGRGFRYYVSSRGGERPHDTSRKCVYALDLLEHASSSKVSDAFLD